MMSHGSSANSSDDPQKLRKLLDTVGPDLLGVYRDETISGDILAISDPDEFSFENAKDWVSLVALKCWYIRHCQISTASTPSPHPFPLTLPGTSQDPFKTPSRTHSTPTNRAISASHLSAMTTSSLVTTPTIVKPEDDNDIIFVSATPTTIKWKRREIIEISDSESSDMEVKQANTPMEWKKLKREPDLNTENMRGIQITREAFIDCLISVDDFKTCWPVGKGERVGYLINAKQDTRNWPECHGEKMSMARKIKSFDQDAWGAGTAGSTKETPYIFPLQTECQVARHICQGIFHCNHIGHEFFNGVERYEPDPNQRQDWWEAERKQNQAESESSARLAAIFYKELHVTPCPHVADDGTECASLPVMRPLKEKNFDGKKSFIGCQGWRKGDQARSHRWATIPRNINEGLLLELFRNKGSYTTSTMNRLKINLPADSKCSYVCPPQNAKGQKKCLYTHFDADGMITTGKLQRHACNARITIYSPVDRNDFRAILIVDNPHNHPMPAQRKPTIDGKTKYGNAAERVGLLGLSVVKLDTGEESE
ncbi:hypothetical protein BDN71DRAFT_1507567 [Pleurotus eryngii]|uniref:Uncharacterized protein n=1 Tax=Pleurotus eryngii TaxID=5323 RepID=A0A9P5ZUL7_PLEER|nr:hypothetical protein BDN71DRAFT_1507567 [Pleurotus eryngii]